MCGIVGSIAISPRAKNLSGSELKKMSDLLSHRGPDDERFFQFQGVSLGHRRLSIIDLQGGAQPIFNEDRSICVILNGEIYNYQELSAQLERQGHVFSTQSDTEVLVHLYEQHGLGFLPLLNGMFALALYDSKMERLLLARDRFGVKPLFYAKDQGRLLFSSELRALKGGLGFEPELNSQALSNYLMLSFVPEPHSIYSGINRLPAGHCMTLGLEHETTHCFADFNFKNKLRIGKQEAAEEALRLFRQAVQRQMVADVPISTLLSSGLDSRSILSALVKGGHSTTAFTLSYAEKSFDEAAGAGSWAAAYGVPHQLIHFQESDFLAMVDERLAQFAEPYGFLCDVGFVHLAKAVRAQGFKVCLSGAGGDELFAGYPTLNAGMAMRSYSKLPGWFRRGLVGSLIQALPAGSGRLPLRFQLKSFNDACSPDLFRAFLLFKQVVSPEQARQLFKNGPLESMVLPDPIEVYEQYRERTAGLHPVDAMSYLDLKVFMGGNVLFSGDHEFMAAGVEQRFPFLDNDLVDFATSLPVEVRFSLFSLKGILKRALGQLAAEDGIGAPYYNKMGFEIPVQDWMRRGGFASRMDSVLMNSRFLNAAFCEQMLKQEREGKENRDRLLQNVYSLGRYLEHRK